MPSLIRDIPGRRKDSKFGYALATLVFAVCWFPIGLYIYGGTLATLWGWFAVPIFGLPALTAVQAYSIGLVASFLKMKVTDKDLEAVQDEADEAFRKTVLRAVVVVVYCVITLGVAWVTKTFFL